MSEQSIDVLKADPQNARRISPEALAGLGVSMQTFGDLSGIVFNQRSGRLVAGHQRMEQLRAAGAKTWRRLSKAEGVIVHPKTEERFPVRIVEWDDTTERLANLAANNPEIQGEFTAEALAQLKALDEHVDFEGLRLDDLYASLEKEIKTRDVAGGGHTDPDDVPEPPKVPMTQPGDLWVLGDHRLLCGDSTKAADVARLMGTDRAALMATDPPYGVDYNEVKSGIVNEGRLKFKDWGTIENDALKPEQLGEFLAAVFAAAGQALGERPAVYVWHPSGDMTQVFRTAMQGAGLLIHRQIIWVKPHMVLTRSGMYHWQHEPCFYGWSKTHVPPWYGEKDQTSVWHVGKDDGKAMHPTQKPVELFEIPMRNHTRKGGVCYEPFSGSGSQIIAAERLGRRCFALEIERRYADVAVTRWEQFTGRKATRQPAAKAAAPARPKPRGKPRRK